MKSIYTTLFLLILITINLYPQFEIKDREINDPKFLNEDLILTKPQARIDPILLDSMITSIMQTSHIPGLAALIVKDDSIVWSSNYGYANIAPNRPVEDSTLFLMASISKTFMVTAIMQLWEDGLFNLDDNINDYLQPDFQVFNPNHPNDTITFKMLMTHTSSIDDNWDILNPIRICGDSPIPLDSFFVNYFTPGGIYYSPINFLGYYRYHYTNTGSCILAYIVEKLSGVPFDQYCGDNIFNPLNITEASWFLEGLDTNKVATPYDWWGQYIRLCHQGWPLYPISKLRINKLELNKFLSTYLNWGTYNGTTILDSTTVSMMLSDQMGHPDPYGDYQGLIWYTTQYDGRWLWGHSGSWWGCRTAMFFSPEEDWGVIMFLNSYPDDQGPRSIFQIICDYAHLYGNIYATHTTVNKPYMIPSIDTVTVITKFVNIKQHDFTANAIYINSASSFIDSTALYDDGLHGDSLANDGLWGGFISPISQEEIFKIGISSLDSETGKYFYTRDLTRFTTAGPVTLDSVSYTKGVFDWYYLRPFVRNEGNAMTITNAAIKILCDDPWVSSVGQSVISLPDIPPGETVVGSSSCVIGYIDSLFPGYFNIKTEIMVEGWTYWAADSMQVIITGVEAEGLPPLTYKLEQNYPNPFNPITTIKYQIPKLSFVTLKVYDVLGSEIITLVNEEKQVGSYQIEFDATILSSGIYFYQLQALPIGRQAGSFVETKKMVLLR